MIICIFGFIVQRTQADQHAGAADAGRLCGVHQGQDRQPVLQQERVAQPLQGQGVLSARVQEHARALQHRRRVVQEVADGRLHRAARLRPQRQEQRQVLRLLRQALHHQDDHQRGRRGPPQHAHQLSQAHRGDARQHAAAPLAQHVPTHRRGQGELRARHAQRLHGQVQDTLQVRHQGLVGGPRRHHQGEGEGLAHVQGQRSAQRGPQHRHRARHEAPLHGQVDARRRLSRLAQDDGLLAAHRHTRHRARRPVRQRQRDDLAKSFRRSTTTAAAATGRRRRR